MKYNMERRYFCLFAIITISNNWLRLKTNIEEVLALIGGCSFINRAFCLEKKWDHFQSFKSLFTTYRVREKRSHNVGHNILALHNVTSLVCANKMDLDIIQNICILIGQEEYSIGGILLSVSVMNSYGKNRDLFIKNKFIGIIYTLIN